MHLNYMQPVFMDKGKDKGKAGMKGEKVTAFTVCITRYNSQTWAERGAWLAANPDYACIYKAPVAIKTNIPYEAPLFVLEMNNDTNRASGWTAPASCGQKQVPPSLKPWSACCFTVLGTPSAAKASTSCPPTFATPPRRLQRCWGSFPANSCRNLICPDIVQKRNAKNTHCCKHEV